MRGTARAFTLMAAVLSLGLTAACADDGGAGGQKPVEQARQNAGKPVTLKYWTSFPPGTTLKGAVAEFERATPASRSSCASSRPPTTRSGSRRHSARTTRCSTSSASRSRR